MSCDNCRDALNAYVDGELDANDRREVAEHLSTCAACSAEYKALGDARKRVKEGLVRYKAPDVLKARIRASVEQINRPMLVPTPRTRSWWRTAVAGGAIAVASSLATFAVTRPSASDASIANEIVTSHIRSLMPGHLIDVASSDQHNVKPWFNGRVNLSPTVPDLSSQNFKLLGGRLDYVDGRAVPVVVYQRRQHLINVYSWPASDASTSAPKTSTVNGYHLVEWRRGGIEQWAVSDLNVTELHEFVSAFSGM
jgi:anti-sigma factor (TIGR02949 family)